VTVDGDAGGWVQVVSLDALWDGDPTVVQVEGVDVLLVRNGEDLYAVANRCTHQGAPLDQGKVDVEGSLRTVTCPAHGSRFDLSSGRVLRPPAAVPLPTYEARVENGMVELRPRPG
jgi:nitrite reductase/ring-hydroxylating ferredoxin subunit